MTDLFVATTIRYRDAWRRFELRETSDRLHEGQVELQAAFAKAIADLTELKATISLGI